MQHTIEGAILVSFGIAMRAHVVLLTDDIVQEFSIKITCDFACSQNAQLCPHLVNETASIVVTVRVQISIII